MRIIFFSVPSAGRAEITGLRVLFCLVPPYAGESIQVRLPLSTIGSSPAMSCASFVQGPADLRGAAAAASQLRASGSRFCNRALKKSAALAFLASRERLPAESRPRTLTDEGARPITARPQNIQAAAAYKCRGPPGERGTRRTADRRRLGVDGRRLACLMANSSLRFLIGAKCSARCSSRSWEKSHAFLWSGSSWGMLTVRGVE